MFKIEAAARLRSTNPVFASAKDLAKIKAKQSEVRDLIKERLKDHDGMTSTDEPTAWIMKDIDKLCGIKPGTVSLDDTDWRTYVVFLTDDEKTLRLSLR